MSKSNVRGRGRPVVYSGYFAKNLVKLVEKHGLTGAVKVASEDGVVKQVGKPKQRVSVSQLTLSKLAKSAGLTLRRGRPALNA